MLSTAVLLAASMVVGQLDAEALSTKQLRSFAAATVGEWEGEGTLPYDLPGFGEKGDRITGVATTAWTLGGAAVQCDWKFGSAEGRWIVILDAEKSILRMYNFNSAGNFSEGTITKQDGKWIAKSAGASGQGKHFSGTAVLSITDNGNTDIWDETDQILGGEKLPDMRHVWKRKTK